MIWSGLLLGAMMGAVMAAVGVLGKSPERRLLAFAVGVLAGCIIVLAPAWFHAGRSK